MHDQFGIGGRMNFKTLFVSDRQKNAIIFLFICQSFLRGGGGGGVPSIFVWEHQF